LYKSKASPGNGVDGLFDITPILEYLDQISHKKIFLLNVFENMLFLL